MSLTADALRVVNIGLSLLDLALIAPALVHARSDRVRGRLIACALVMVGLIVGSGSRFGGQFNPGLPFVTLGLLAWARFLPPGRGEDIADDRGQ